MRLEEWYEDRELFHVIGFILQQGGRGNIFYNYGSLGRWFNFLKLSFSRSLRRKIFKSIFGLSLDDIDANELLQEISEFQRKYIPCLVKAEASPPIIQFDDLSFLIRVQTCAFSLIALSANAGTSSTSDL